MIEEITFIQNQSDISDWYRKQGSTQKKVGLEYEKIGIKSLNGETARYTGENGYLAILKKFHEELGWKITKKRNNFILQLKRGKTILDLESDGRIELAGSPHDSIHDLVREFRIHQHEISEISDVFGISWLGIGFHPVSKNEAIENLPLPRKTLMWKFFTNIKKSTGNDFGLAWYKKTAGIHTSFDYIDSEQACAKSQALLKIAPVITAMFANSPFSNGASTGYLSYRQHVGHASNIKNLQVPKSLFDSFEDVDQWVKYLCSLPTLFIRKKNGWIKPNITFGKYITDGYKGHKATWEDFHMHLKSVWMTIRLRETIEFRAIDALPPSLTPSAAAFMKGLYYHPDFCSVVQGLTKYWSFDDYNNLLEDISRNGLQASIRYTKVLDIAKELLRMSDDRLKRDRIVNFKGQNESVHLEPLKKLILVQEKCPARWLMEKWETTWGQNFFPVFEWEKY